MHTCRECRYFAFFREGRVRGGLDLGRCLLGGFTICAEERACESRTMRAGEIARRCSGGFAMVAEDQGRWDTKVALRGLHTLQRVPRTELTSINEQEENE